MAETILDFSSPAEGEAKSKAKAGAVKKSAPPKKKTTGAGVRFIALSALADYELRNVSGKNAKGVIEHNFNTARDLPLEDGATKWLGFGFEGKEVKGLADGLDALGYEKLEAAIQDPIYKFLLDKDPSNAYKKKLRSSTKSEGGGGRVNMLTHTIRAALPWTHTPPPGDTSPRQAGGMNFVPYLLPFVFANEEGDLKMVDNQILVLFLQPFIAKEGANAWQKCVSDFRFNVALRDPEANVEEVWNNAGYRVRRASAAFALLPLKSTTMEGLLVTMDVAIKQIMTGKQDTPNKDTHTLTHYGVTNKARYVQEGITRGSALDNHSVNITSLDPFAPGFAQAMKELLSSGDFWNNAAVYLPQQFGVDNWNTINTLAQFETNLIDNIRVAAGVAKVENSFEGVSDWMYKQMTTTAKKHQHDCNAYPTGAILTTTPSSSILF